MRMSNIISKKSLPCLVDTSALSARLITRSIYATAEAEDGYGSLYLNTDGECPNALLKRELRWLAQQNPHFSAISDSGR